MHLGSATLAVKEEKVELLYVHAPPVPPHLQRGDRNLPLTVFAWTQDLSRKGTGADQGGDILLFCTEIKS